MDDGAVSIPLSVASAGVALDVPKVTWAEADEVGCSDDSIVGDDDDNGVVDVEVEGTAGDDGNGDCAFFFFLVFFVCHWVAGSVSSASEAACW